MRARFTTAWTTGLTAGVLSLALLVTLTCPASTQAQEMRIRPYNHGRGMESPVRSPQVRDDSEKAVRLSGTFLYGLRSGLTIQDRPVRVSPNTTVFPSLGDRSYLPDPGDLEGRQGTVYGHPGPNGIEAVLIILQGEVSYRVNVSAELSRPAPTEEGLVELAPGTPQ